MSSPLKAIDSPINPTERLFAEMGKRLQAAAGQDINNKLASGEIKLINGRYVGASLEIKRPDRAKKIPAYSPK
jgi:hypothetical protein